MSERFRAGEIGGGTLAADTSATEECRATMGTMG